MLLLLGVVVVVVALLSRDAGIVKKGEPPIPSLEFAATAKNVVQTKAPAGSVSDAERDAIVKMFNDYYQEAFVDPRKWGDGTFEDLKALFAQDAQASFTKDIAALTIGEGRTELRRVDRPAGTLTVSVYYDGKSKPTFAVATATFEARGTLKESGPSVTIKQKATFYLQKVGDAWKITAYDADQSQETPTPTPTASAT